MLEDSSEEQYVGSGDPYCVPAERRTTTAVQSPSTSHDDNSPSGELDVEMLCRLFSECDDLGLGQVPVRRLLQHMRNSLPGIADECLSLLRSVLDPDRRAISVSQSSFLDAVTSVSQPQTEYTDSDVSALQCRIEQLEYTIRSLHEEREEARQQLQQLEENNVALSSRVGQLQHTNSTLTADARRVPELRVECEALQTALQSEQRQRRHLYEQSELLQLRVRKYELEIDKLTESLSRAEDEIACRVEVETELHVTAERARCQLQQLTAALMDQQARAAGAQLVVDNCQDSLRQAQDSVLATLAEKQRQEDELLVLKRQLHLVGSFSVAVTADSAVSRAHTPGSIRDEIYHSIEYEVGESETSAVLPLSGITASCLVGPDNDSPQDKASDVSVSGKWPPASVCSSTPATGLTAGCTAPPRLSADMSPINSRRSLAVTSVVGDTDAVISVVDDTDAVSSVVGDTDAVSSVVDDTDAVSSVVGDTDAVSSVVGDTDAVIRVVGDTDVVISDVDDTDAVTSVVDDTDAVAGDIDAVTDPATSPGDDSSPVNDDEAAGSPVQADASGGGDLIRFSSSAEDSPVTGGTSPITGTWRSGGDTGDGQNATSDEAASTDLSSRSPDLHRSNRGVSVTDNCSGLQRSTSDVEALTCAVDNLNLSSATPSADENAIQLSDHPKTYSSPSLQPRRLSSSPSSDLLSSSFAEARQLLELDESRALAAAAVTSPLPADGQPAAVGDVTSSSAADLSADSDIRQECSSSDHLQDLSTTGDVTNDPNSSSDYGSCPGSGDASVQMGSSHTQTDWCMRQTSLPWPLADVLGRLARLARSESNHSPEILLRSIREKNNNELDDSGSTSERIESLWKQLWDVLLQLDISDYDWTIPCVQISSPEGDRTSLDDMAQTQHLVRTRSLSVAAAYDVDNVNMVVTSPTEFDPPSGAVLPSAESVLENKFTSLALSFKTDRQTLQDRLKLQRRHRDQMEDNLHQEVSNFSHHIMSLQITESGDEAGDKLKMLQNQLDVLKQISQRLCCTAEALGAVEQEMRHSQAVEVMTQLVDSLRQLYGRERAELLEARRLLAVHNVSVSPGPGSPPMPGLGHPALRRRASLASYLPPARGSFHLTGCQTTAPGSSDSALSPSLTAAAAAAGDASFSCITEENEEEGQTELVEEGGGAAGDAAAAPLINGTVEVTSAELPDPAISCSSETLTAPDVPDGVHPVTLIPVRAATRRLSNLINKFHSYFGRCGVWPAGVPPAVTSADLSTGLRYTAAALCLLLAIGLLLVMPADSCSSRGTGLLSWQELLLSVAALRRIGPQPV